MRPSSRSLLILIAFLVCLAAAPLQGAPRRPADADGMVANFSGKCTLRHHSGDSCHHVYPWRAGTPYDRKSRRCAAPMGAGMGKYGDFRKRYLTDMIGRCRHLALLPANVVAARGNTAVERLNLKTSIHLFLWPKNDLMQG